MQECRVPLDKWKQSDVLHAPHVSQFQRHDVTFSNKSLHRSQKDLVPGVRAHQGRACRTAPHWGICMARAAGA